MSFYWGLAIIGLILSVISEFSKDKYMKHVSLFLFFLILLVLSAIRINIGVDYDGHYHAYEGIINKNLYIMNMYKREPLYYGINLLCYYLNWGFYGVVVIMSFITIYPIYKIAKDEKAPYILLLYFFMGYCISYALIRQFGAISLSFYGTYLYQRKNKKKTGLFFMILGGGIHVSLWFYFVIFLIGKFVKFNLTITIVFTLIIVLIFPQINVIGLIASVLNGTKFGGHLGAGNSNNVQTEINGFIGVIGIGVRFLIYFADLYILWKNNQTKNFRYNLLFLALIFSHILSLQIVIFLRLRFVFFGLTLLPFIYTKINKKRNALFSLTNVIYLFVLFANILGFPATVAWGNIPYQTLFFHELVLD